MLIQDLGRVETIRNDCKRVLAYCTWIKQFYLFVNENLIAAQHSVSDSELLEVLKGFSQ